MEQFIPHPQLSDIPRESALCFTGHRPEKLPTGLARKALRQTLYHYITHAIEMGYTYFFTGLADGIDFDAAYFLFCLREKNPAIHVIGIQPCSEGYDEFFHSRGYSIPHLRLMQQNCDRLIVMPGRATDRNVYLTRNCLMVDHSSAIIAVCGDGRSGSMQTLRYARRQNLDVIRIYPFPPSDTLPQPIDWPAERSGF